MYESKFVCSIGKGASYETLFKYIENQERQPINITT